VVRPLYKTDTNSEPVKRRMIDGMLLVLKRGSDIHTHEDYWYVPSSRPDILYRVSVRHKACQCPDNSKGGWLCKHYWAAKLMSSILGMIQREVT
jgi:SWIM zinc finger